jgi:hypothetical protein
MTVTGICSCEKDGSGSIRRVIRVRKQSDIVPVLTGSQARPERIPNTKAEGQSALRLCSQST